MDSARVRNGGRRGRLRLPNRLAGYDVVVVGAGAAGLMTALAAASRGASVCVLESSAQAGGSCSVSGGMVWVPDHGLPRVGPVADSPELARTYLRQVAGERLDAPRLEAFIAGGRRAMAFLHTKSPVRLVSLDRPDYHPEWEGAVDGRTLEPLPLAVGELGELLRVSPVRPPLTFLELRGELGGRDAAEVAAERRRDGVRTQGAALAGGLLLGCRAAGVELRLSCQFEGLVRAGDRVSGVRAGGSAIEAGAGVVLAAGGFEWDADLRRAFLPGAGAVPTTPPWNRGQTLLAAIAAGAAVGNLTEAWWTAAYAVPGETYDGNPLVRNIVGDLALPGSILVNRGGRRFVNEASNYHDLGRSFHAYDQSSGRLSNLPAWLVVDGCFRRRYALAGTPPGAPAPGWMVEAGSPAELAAACGIDAAGLCGEVDEFNAGAAEGLDAKFGRGRSRHDRFYGDAANAPNPCLAPLREPPFTALPITLGLLGTKGGVRTDPAGRVLTTGGDPIPGLFGCGNVAASVMGDGYPGAGGTLGPILTEAFLCGSGLGAR